MQLKKTLSVVGGVNNDTGIGVSHSMSALSLHSRVTQQLHGTGEDGHGKCLYVFELFDCYLRWAGTDQVSSLTAQFKKKPELARAVLRGVNRGDLAAPPRRSPHPAFGPKTFRIWASIRSRPFIPSSIEAPAASCVYQVSFERRSISTASGQRASISEVSPTPA